MSRLWSFFLYGCDVDGAKFESLYKRKWNDITQDEDEFNKMTLHETYLKIRHDIHDHLSQKEVSSLF
jgi:hypothetical protein